MKATRNTVSPVGLTVLYEPEPSSAAIAEYVFPPLTTRTGWGRVTNTPPASSSWPA